MGRQTSVVCSRDKTVIISYGTEGVEKSEGKYIGTFPSILGLLHKVGSLGPGSETRTCKIASPLSICNQIGGVISVSFF